VLEACDACFVGTGLFVFISRVGVSVFVATDEIAVEVLVEVGMVGKGDG
jgi:uncharacterized membrane protein